VGTLLVVVVSSVSIVVVVSVRIGGRSLISMLVGIRVAVIVMSAIILCVTETSG